MKKIALFIAMCLIIISLDAQVSLQEVNGTTGISECAEVISLYGTDTNAADLDQGTIASIARCYVQMLDNLQAARWFEQIVDLDNCRPEYLFEYGQCLKSLKLYGKAKFYFQKYAQHDPVKGNYFMQSCDIAKLELSAEQLYEVTPMSSNTPSSEYAPMPAGGSVKFNAWSHHPSPSHLYWMNTSTGAVQQYAGGAPELGGISHLRYSADGRFVAFASDAFAANQRLYNDNPGTKIYYGSTSSGDKWAEVSALPFCDETYAVAYPCLSTDGSEIYFASTMPGGEGGWDLYMAKRTGDIWNKPVNLGQKINTPGNEISPFFTAGKLYFSSDWHAGIGGYDVFVTMKSGNSYGDVRSLGYPVNSPKDDIDFAWDAGMGWGYLASNRTGGAGLYDLYKAKPQFREIQVSVMDKEKMQPMENTILMVTPGISMAYYTDVMGSAILNLPLTEGHEILVKKDGYVDQKVKLNSNDKTSNRYEINLEPVVVESIVQQDAVVKTSESRPQPKQVTGQIAEAPVENEIAPVPVKEAEQTREMYFVQIAALARHSSLDPYEGLRMYGDVLMHDDGMYSKVRIGTFATEEEARLVLSRIRSIGFIDAFVVRQRVSDHEARSTSQSSSINDYKVRLATYSKTGNFDPSKVVHLGSIESYRKDDLTIMLLGGYHNLDAAKEARDAAASQGFADAYVVMDNAGVLERVR